jgi:hypothetical protein
MRKSRTDRTSLLPAGRLVGLLVGFVVGHRCLGEARLSPHTYLIMSVANVAEASGRVGEMELRDPQRRCSAKELSASSLW